MRTAPNERLAGQTSPYILQHADNPVDWYPWGPEAFERAKAEDKPVFLSVGYAACHWCHVMAHESFEDQETAAELNERFVSIKVDREERPDVDAVYMDAVQAMTGSGGWPMSVFLTPDGEPFYAGTYFPDQSRHGMPSFRQVLDGIAEAWQDRRSDVQEQSGRVTEAIGRAVTSEGEALDPDGIHAITGGAVETLHRSFDERWGGFGGAPKFPQASVLRWLLDRAARGDPDARAMLTRTLDAMADGGIHDHVGGGFARYSTDAMWHVPHFEKMLYDNAQLLTVYAHAAVVTGNDRYRHVAMRVAGWMLREMQQPEGGFSSSQDADSDGVEGAFFVWSWEELTSIVGETVAEALGATPEGNWEGANVLWFPRPIAEVAAANGIDEATLGVEVERGLDELLEHRDKRTHPPSDDKVVTAWNGLAIEGLAIAGAALGEPSLLDAAERCASFIWDNLRDADGRLLRTWRDNSARVPGFADDHGSLGIGLCALYERTGETPWLLRAQELGEALITLFASGDGAFHQVGSDAEMLVVRKLDLLDEPTPSGNSSAAGLLLRLSHYTGDGRYDGHADRALQRVEPILERAPTAAGSALRALELWAGPTVEVAIVGGRSSPDTLALLDVVVGGHSYLPNAIVGLADPADAGARDVQLFDGRLSATEAIAYVCERFVCKLPVSTAEALSRELASSLHPAPGMPPAS
jgi:uncharacterized protein YyaL (SSP411 family)